MIMEQEKLKIGLFNECFPPIQDGVSQVMENYARVMHNLGHDVTVVTAKVPSHDYSKYPYDIQNVKSIPIPVRKPYRWGLPIWMAPNQPVMRYQADVMHVHSPFTAARIAMKLAKKNGTPLVATFHSKYRDDFRRSVPSDTIVNMMVKNIMQVYNAVDEVWVPQQSVLEVMREYGYKGKAEVVPNAVDFEVTTSELDTLIQSSRQKLQLPADIPCFLFVGQIILEKRVDYILESLKILRDRGFAFRMYFVGKGYAVQTLKNKIAKYNLESCVFYVEQIQSRTELQCYYAAADLFLFPSIYDNAPLVLREAAVHQTPSILTIGSNSAEVVEDAVNGYLGVNETPQHMADLIQTIFADKMKLSAVAIEARKTLGLTWNQVVPEVLDRYRMLIKRKGK